VVSPPESHCQCGYPAAAASWASPADLSARPLAASVCKKAHLLEKCTQFKKFSPEQWVLKANEMHLCLICLRHTPGVPRQGEAGLQGVQREWVRHRAPPPHALSPHGDLIQVHVAAESYPPGTQVFQLRQRVKMGKTEVGLVLMAAVTSPL
jgi:hypothetical protein